MKRYSSVLTILYALSALNTIYSKDIGAEPPRRACSPCGCNPNCPFPLTQQGSPTGTSISRTEGTLNEMVPVSNAQSALGSTMPFAMLYSSYNADGSRSWVDTGMGYGWTHTYNVFLFSQLGSMFRYDEMGRVTRYKVGTGGIYVTPNGFFETLVKNGDGSYTLTTKEKTVYRFESVPNTPFLVGGPVWRLVKIADRNNNTTTMTYPSGDLTTVTDTYGRVTQFTYNAQHRLVSSTDPAGRVTTFTYDSTGKKLTTITDPNGKSIQYTYDINYRLTGKTDKDGRTFTYTYQNNVPVSVHDSANQSSATLFNSNNWGTNSTQLALNQLRVYTPSTSSNTDGRGNVWQYQYDANGYITQSIAPDGAATAYTYDPATLMQSATKTDANGHTTSFQYDTNGNLTKLTDPARTRPIYTYEPTYNQDDRKRLMPAAAPPRIPTTPTAIACRKRTRSARLANGPTIRTAIR